MAKNMLTPAQTQQLKRTLASGSLLGATDLRIINLDVYRERLGKAWPKYKGIINAYAADAIKTELGNEDIFVETNNGYGIFFFRKNIECVGEASARIANRFNLLLSRDLDFGDPPLGCVPISVNCDELLHQLEAEARSERPTATNNGTQAPRPTAQPQPASGYYAPLWHAKLQHTVGSIYVPNTPPPLRRAPDREYYASSSLRVNDDIRRFSEMSADAYKLHKAGQSTAIFFSLNFPTFCEPRHLKEYMQVLRQTPASLLKYLTPRFVRIPPGTAPSLLASRVGTLTTIFKHVVLQERPPVDLRGLEFVPCSILAMSWKDAVHTAGQDAGALEKAVSAFCLSARMLRANSLIEAIETPAAFEMAAAAGADFLSGAAIARREKVPFVQQPLSIDCIRDSHRQSPPPNLHSLPQASSEVDFV